jgi:hypothetical protein
MAFITKHSQDKTPQKIEIEEGKNTVEAVEEEVLGAAITINDNKKTVADERKNAKKKKNNVSENKSNMNTSEKIAMAQNILGNKENNFKVLKSDKGLIERTESSKTILTEDNKELLID